MKPSERIDEIEAQVLKLAYGVSRKQDAPAMGRVTAKSEAIKKYLDEQHESKPKEDK